MNRVYNKKESVLSRIPYIDNVKCFGMLLVVLGHTYYEMTPLEEYNANIPMDFVAIFYMKMFFFYSGFVYKFKDIGTLSFTWKSFKSLIYPVILFTILNMILRECYLMTYEKHISVTWDALIDTYWFCKCLFVCRIVLFLTIKFTIAQNRINHNFYTLGGVLIISIITTILMYAFSMYIEIPWGFKTVYPYYYIGYIIASSKFQVKNYEMRKMLIFFSIFGVLLLSWMRYDIGEINPTIDKFTHVLLPIPIIYLIHIFFKSFLNKEIAFLSTFGKTSLLIYLIHLLILSLFCTVYDSVFESRLSLNNIVAIILVFFILSIASLQIGLKINNNKLLSRILLLK